MKRLSAAVVVIVLAVAAPAGAHYFLDHGSAVSHARNHFHNLGYHYTAARCRPKGLSAPAPNTLYHDWVCSFAVGDSRFSPSCTGLIQITGTADAGFWRFRVISHAGPCPRGVKAG